MIQALDLLRRLGGGSAELVHRKTTGAGSAGMHPTP
jgi:hypothetical protein